MAGTLEETVLEDTTWPSPCVCYLTMMSHLLDRAAWTLGGWAQGGSAVRAQGGGAQGPTVTGLKAAALVGPTVAGLKAAAGARVELMVVGMKAATRVGPTATGQAAALIGLMVVDEGGGYGWWRGSRWWGWLGSWW